VIFNSLAITWQAVPPRCFPTPILLIFFQNYFPDDTLLNQLTEFTIS